MLYYDLVVDDLFDVNAGGLLSVYVAVIDVIEDDVAI